MSQPCGDIIFSYDQTIHQKSHEKSIQLRSSGGNHSTSQYTFHFLMFQKKRLILFSVLWKVWFEKKLFSIRTYFATDSNVMYAKLHPISFVQTEIFHLFAEIFSISMLCNTGLSVDSSLPAEAYHVTQPSLYRSSHQIHLQISELRQMRFLELFKQYIKTLRIANGPAHLLLAILIPGLQI